MKYLIFNADDFGASTGINRGILECHRHGVVTSTSLMVTGRAVPEAVSISRDNPRLAVGLHWDVWGEEDEARFDIGNICAVRDQFHRQLEKFNQLLGRMPTHIDSHRHAHVRGELLSVFRELLEPLGLPLRYDGTVRCVDSFYGQSRQLVTHLEYVSVPVLQQLLRDQIGEGWTELLCHPGRVSPDFTSVYLIEREAELRTLVDPRIRETIEQENICLASYADYPSAMQDSNA
jgi:predicted glycoside hydrolase/deacetylase ChbG (UPF0249 family)